MIRSGSYFPSGRGGEGSQAAGKVRQAVVFKTAFGGQIFQLGEVHMGGEIQLAGIEEGILNPLVISDGDQGAGRSGRGKS